MTTPLEQGEITAGELAIEFGFWKDAALRSAIAAAVAQARAEGFRAGLGRAATRIGVAAYGYRGLAASVRAHEHEIIDWTIRASDLEKLAAELRALAPEDK